MSAAQISLHGQTVSRDRLEETSFDITVPVIHKGFILWWREVIASRNGGMPLETRSIEKAARKCAEEEDKLLLSGEYTGFKALGVEGLATATGRNTKASSGAWPAKALDDINAAIGELETDGYNGPYALVLRPNWNRKLYQLIANTGIYYIEKVREICTRGVFISNNLYSSGGLTTSGLVVHPSQEHFEMVIGEDLSAHSKEDEDGNLRGVVREVVAPRVKLPESICEITGLT